MRRAKSRAVVFIGKDADGNKSINAAKRWVREQKFPQYHIRVE